MKSLPVQQPTWKVIFYYFCFFLFFSFGFENWLEGIEIFISPPLQRSYLSPTAVSPTTVAAAGLPLLGASSLEVGLLRLKPPLVFPFPAPLHWWSVSSVRNHRWSPARSLTGRDRPSRWLASVLVVGHPPPGHPSPAFCLRRIWRPDLYLSTLKKVLSGDALSVHRISPPNASLSVSSPAGDPSFSAGPYLSLHSFVIHRR
jgi:hypothetical protein